MTPLWRKEKSILYGIHPEKVPASGARLGYTFGLGGITVLAFIITLLTGIALAFYYEPTPADAHNSIIAISDVATYGSVIRALHYWAAQLMVVAVSLHRARVVFTGAYGTPRLTNWLIGLALLVITLLWDFSGYVLRWDAGGYWAFLVGTNLLREIPGCGEAVYRVIVGDRQITANALLRFYVWHVVVFTFMGLCGIYYHLFRLRKDGGISVPAQNQGEVRTLISREDLFFREFAVLMCVCAALLLLSWWAPPQIGPAANLNAGVREVRAPWIFLWVQDLLRFLPSFWAGIAAPVFVLALMVVLPFAGRRLPGRALWFARERWKTHLLFSVLALILIALSIREALR